MGEALTEYYRMTQDGPPAKARLDRSQNQEFEEALVIVEGQPPLEVV